MYQEYKTGAQKKVHHGKYEPKASMVQGQMISAVFTPLHNSKNKYCLENCPLKEEATFLKSNLFYCF